MGKNIYTSPDLCQFDDLRSGIKSCDVYSQDSNAAFARSVRRATLPDISFWGDGGWTQPEQDFARLLHNPQKQTPWLSNELSSKPSSTELAMSEFLKRVKHIRDVKVKVYGGDTLSEQSVVIEVPSILSPAARSVARLQGEMYRKYPGASVRVDITESQVHTSSVDDLVRAER